MALRELLVDQVLAPDGGATPGCIELFVPVEPVPMAVCPDDIVFAVAFEVLNEDGTASMRQV